MGGVRLGYCAIWRNPATCLGQDFWKNCAR